MGVRKQSQENGDNKQRWPGLNVVTNFPKPSSLSQRAIGNDAKQNAGLGLKKQQGGSISMSRKASVETLGLGHQPSGRSLRTVGSKGRLGNLKRASSKWSNLSPSDRAVMIGISVSPEELAQHPASPGASPARSQGSGEQHAVDQHSSAMPTIVVTPAKEKAPWSVEEELTQSEKPRAASSVYSQVPTHNGPQFIGSGIVPPIPPLPPDGPRQDTQNGEDEPAKKGLPNPRITSTYTDIDEGESPEIQKEERPSSGASQLRILTLRSSMDTIATRHRSQGWWNHIVSPFFTKSPMTFKASASPREPVPNVSSPLKQDQSLQEARQTFPPPPESDGLGSGHTSWTDSAMDADYEKRLELDGFCDRSTMIVDEPQEELMRESTLLPRKFEGFGAAAEYYEACLYDMHSETPYFECQNHACLPPNSRVRGAASTEREASRGIGGDTNPGSVPDAGRPVEPLLAAQQAPKNRFSAAFREAIRPKSKLRPQSDATVIEELETTPDIQEAHAAPVVRAAAPVPAAQPPLPHDAPKSGSSVADETAPPSDSTGRAAPPRLFSPSITQASTIRATPVQVHSPPVPSKTPPQEAHARAYAPLSPASTHQSPARIRSPHLPNSTPPLKTTSTESPPRQERQPKRYVAVLPPEHHAQPVLEQPLSPEPLSPNQQHQPLKDAIPLEDVHRDNADPNHALNTAGTTYDYKAFNPNHITTVDPISAKGDATKSHIAKSTISPKDVNLDERNSRDAFNSTRKKYYRQDGEPGQTTVADLYPPPKDTSKTQRLGQYKEKGDLAPLEKKKKDPVTFPKCRSCFNGAKPRDKKEKKMMMIIATGLTLLIILILILVMTLTLKKKGKKMPVQAQWLNLTNFPPIPTGVATIIQPNAVEENPDCVHPGTMWSCAVPKEDQQNLSPNAPNQPNFRIQITFQNGTNATTNATAGSSSAVHRRSYGHIANGISARGFIKNRILHIRDVFGDNQFTPSPAPPNLEEQEFLGNTTDRNAAPFDGEFTPFFMSFQPAQKLSSRLMKRQSAGSRSDTNPFPNPTNAIPAPNANPDGTAAEANLYPYPSSQPLRLYDRGLDTEHYGFYTYFDRSIFLKSNTPLDLSSSNETTPVPDDEDGGADENAASVRCTWAQTRFLVQIWTKKGNSASLLQPSNTTSSHHSPTTPTNTTTLSTSSANDFTQPGSFPYPITITLDRHGGDITKKMVYCYGLDDREHFNSTAKQFQVEDRGMGGQLVNPALGPFGDVNVSTAQGGPGGVDGGSGGCACRWQNWGTGL